MPTAYLLSSSLVPHPPQILQLNQIAVVHHLGAIYVVYAALSVWLTHKGPCDMAPLGIAGGALIAIMGVRWAAELFEAARWWTLADAAENLLPSVIWIALYSLHRAPARVAHLLGARVQASLSAYTLLRLTNLRTTAIIHVATSWQHWISAAWAPAAGYSNQVCAAQRPAFSKSSPRASPRSAALVAGTLVFWASALHLAVNLLGITTYPHCVIIPPLLWSAALTWRPLMLICAILSAATASLALGLLIQMLALLVALTGGTKALHLLAGMLYCGGLTGMLTLT